MDISVILPTRLRHGPLKRSIESLRFRSDEEFELLIAVDEDDPTDYSGYENVLRSPRWGYANLHRYMNALAEAASGDWVFVWNDDCLMMTDHWDAVIRGYPLDRILSPHTIHDPLCTFPAVPKRFIEEVGHFALNAHTDTWWQEIAEMLGILTWVPVEIRHERADVTGMNNDSVFRERQYQTEGFNSMIEVRRQEALAIRRLLTEEVSEDACDSAGG